MPNSSEIQNEINAVSAAGGGRISIPRGVWTGNPLLLPTAVQLEGQGYVTVIPPVLSRGGTPTSPTVIENAGLARLKIMGIAALDEQGSPVQEYLYGWRVERGKHCRSIDVSMDRVAYGQIFVGDSSYNTALEPVISARIHCFEFYSDNPNNGDNQNGIHNGKLTATGAAGDSPACIAIYNSNGLGVTGITSMETSTNSYMKFIKRVNSSGVVCAGAIRAERVGLGPLWFNGKDEIGFDGVAQPWEY